MFKKTKQMIFLVAAAFLLLSYIPQNAFAASGILQEYYPPSDSDFYQKRISFKYYNDFGTTKIRFIQLEYGTGIELGRKEFAVKENSDLWIDQTCKGQVAIQWLNAAGDIVYSMNRGDSDSYLGQGDCNNIANPSNFNETKNQYADDTFGATKTAPGTPGQDGSGGDGSTGLDTGGGTDPGTDPGTGGTDPAADCPECKVFDCPKWDEYMGGLNDIKNAIPPAPDWLKVARNFRDIIVPAVTADMENMLGTAPEPDPDPADMPDPSNRGINNEEPSMNDIPGLDDSGFSADKVKDSAPVIPEREDPTGGFDLIKDPMSTLPDLPGDSFPKPGSTDPGAWGSNKPAQPDNPFPNKPTEQDPDTGAAPKPADSGATPPNPADTGGTAPTPGDSGGTAPKPSDDPFPGMIDYKPNPDAPDGSGGDINP